MTEYSYPEFFEAVARHRGPVCWVRAVLIARRAALLKGSADEQAGWRAKWVRFYDCDGAPDAHHLVSKQRIKAEYAERVRKFHGPRPFPLNAMLMDPRNGVICCRRHHDLLERRLVVPARAELPEDAVEFAAEIGMEWSVERDYPAAA